MAAERLAAAVALARALRRHAGAGGRLHDHRQRADGDRDRHGLQHLQSRIALAKNANGTVDIKCPLGIGLLPSFTRRAVGRKRRQRLRAAEDVDGASRLGYNIYTTSGYATVWGDGTGSTVTQTYSAIISLGTISFTAYGQAPSGQYVATGPYSDSITVTVTY